MFFPMDLVLYGWASFIFLNRASVFVQTRNLTGDPESEARYTIHTTTSSHPMTLILDGNLQGKPWLYSCLTHSPCVSC